MSDPLAPKRRKRDLLHLPFRQASRSRSSTPQSQLAVTQPPPASVPVQPAVTQSPQTTVASVLIQPAATQLTPASPISPAVQPLSVTSSPTSQAAGGAPSATDAAFVEEVRKRLSEEQLIIIDDSNAQGSGNISSTFESVYKEVEKKKAECISKRWTMSIGSRMISPREKADKVVELLVKFKPIVDLAAGADPIHFGLPWAGVSLILQVAAGEKRQMDAILSGIITALSIQQTLHVYLEYLNHLAPGPSTKALETALIETYAAVLVFLANCIEPLSKSSVWRFWKSLLDDGELQKFASTCIAAEERLHRTASSCDRVLGERVNVTTQECRMILDLVLVNLGGLCRQTSHIEQNTDLQKLRTASDAAFSSFDEQSRSRCLEGTRIELLDKMEDWVRDSKEVQIFWLQGAAGTGKSTVARTIATSLHENGILGVSFFFKFGHAERGSAERFFATIARQLAFRVPEMASALSRSLDNQFNQENQGLQIQFEKLILDPLKSIGPLPRASQSQFVIVIDALDECDTSGTHKDDIKQILERLSQLKDIPGLRLRMIVTSRLEPSVARGFGGLPNGMHDDVLLHQIPPDQIERDIKLFITARLDELRKDLRSRLKREVLPPGWPGDEIVRELTLRSVPLFIYASTICLFIADEDTTPDRQLQILRRNPNQAHLDDLDDTYELILRARSRNHGAMNNFRKIVGLIIFSTEPPSINTIAVLLGLSSDLVEATLGKLHSVLDVTTDWDRPVQPFHLSFIEFLARRPEGAHEFQIDERTTHEFIADRCLATMMQSGNLQQDICQVRKPGSKRLEIESHVINSHIRPALSYACRYWVHHLEAADVVIDDQHGTLALLSSWFLYWYEAMSWLGKASEVPRTLRKLQVSTKEDRAPSTVEILADAYQFARHNQYIVDLALLQLYASALVFAPDISIIKTQFKPCMPSWLLNTPKVEAFWPGDVLKFEGHTGYIRAIAFSSDDKLLGTCSDDGTARVWDTTDAICLLTVSHDKDEYHAEAVAFSSDSSKVAVAYIHSRREDTTNVLHSRWEDPTNVLVTIYAELGTPLRTMQWPESELLNDGLCLAVAFADDEHHDAVVLAVAGMDYVQVWRSVNDSDILIRAWTSRFPSQEGPHPIAISISQDASLLCCSGVLDENGHGDSSISVLDMKTGAVTSKHGPDEELGDINFSGRTLVYQTRREEWYLGGLDYYLRSFDPGTPGESTHLLNCGGFWPKFSLANAKDRVAFKPVNNHTVHVEKIPESKRVGGWMQGLYHRHVAVAPKGDLVAIWNDESLTVLDTKGLVMQTIRPDVDDGDMRFRMPRCLAISPDCQQIALGLNEGVAVWNIKNGQLLQYNDIKYQDSLAFSNDNGTLACADNHEISLWYLESSERKLLPMRFWSLRDKSRRWQRLEFSVDGQFLLTRDSSLHIPTETWTTLPESTKSSVFGKEVDVSGSSSNFGWVQFDGEDLLWIPDGYRAMYERHDARGNTVALGQEDGRVMVLTFDPTML